LSWNGIITKPDERFDVAYEISGGEKALASRWIYYLRLWAFSYSARYSQVLNHCSAPIVCSNRGSTSLLSEAQKDEADRIAAGFVFFGVARNVFSAESHRLVCSGLWGGMKKKYGFVSLTQVLGIKKVICQSKFLIRMQLTRSLGWVKLLCRRSFASSDTD
jgi:hypothetical protein